MGDWPPAGDDVPLAAIGPKNVELVAELAEYWQPLFLFGRSDSCGVSRFLNRETGDHWFAQEGGPVHHSERVKGPRVVAGLAGHELRVRRAGVARSPGWVNRP